MATPALDPGNGADRSEQMNIVVVGHVDHGKSTVVGRLLSDTGSLPEGKLEAVRKECQRTGKPFEYAFLLDALTDEQDQGITIDTARSFFKTPKRDYIIIDAPGHIEFLKNMISGAARAEAAALIIDAKEGVRENSRRHGYILSMLGIKQVVICVNKMDLVDRSEKVFQAIEKEYRAFLSSIGAVTPQHFIPVSAVNGENLSNRSDKMPWYKGPTLLESLDAFKKAPSKNDRAFRMPVQAVYKFVSQGDDRRIIAGRIEAGKAKVGDKVVFFPSNKSSTIKSIEAFNAPARKEIDAGWSTGFTLSEEIYVTRGELMALADQPPLVSTRFRANLIWLGKKPFSPDRDYKLKIHTQALPVRIHKINKVIDASEAGSDALDKKRSAVTTSRTSSWKRASRSLSTPLPKAKPPDASSSSTATTSPEAASSSAPSKTRKKNCAPKPSCATSIGSAAASRRKRAPKSWGIARRF